MGVIKGSPPITFCWGLITCDKLLLWSYIKMTLLVPTTIWTLVQVIKVAVTTDIVIDPFSVGILLFCLNEVIFGVILLVGAHTKSYMTLFIYGLLSVLFMIAMIALCTLWFRRTSNEFLGTTLELYECQMLAFFGYVYLLIQVYVTLIVRVELQIIFKEEMKRWNENHDSNNTEKSPFDKLGEGHSNKIEVMCYD